MPPTYRLPETVADEDDPEMLIFVAVATIEPAAAELTPARSIPALITPPLIFTFVIEGAPEPP